MGTMKCRKVTRMTHQKDSMEIMGMTALPAPRSTAARLWLAASRKKNSEQMCALSTPKPMDSGSSVKARISSGASR